MQLIAEKLGKSDKLDRLRYVRDDGSSTQTAMPRQGILPHDLVHYVVESTLGLRNGFTGLVARGAEASFAMEMAHDPAGKQVETEAIQVEAVVEALQSQLWSGQFDDADFAEAVRVACLGRERAPFDLAGIDAERLLYQGALELTTRWMAVPFHGTLTLTF
ncbi:hypothetical protein IV454_17945 [Massilia antarctica]|uniref:Uncharacterized protein n=1 Tax=Massilia antarctica TaxID=2765360 RepID=A0AA48W5N4_9BURK|nr:hypothetical protein [Massilia antarctica]QPI47490.1 hypothetical protein IV454_17945 [Massilia antarctica]